MAHFAQIDENGVVIQVIVVSNDDCGGGEFPNSETIGQEFISQIGIPGTWKQTSYNANFRKQFAGQGFSYDEENDVFIVPKLYNSWALDDNFDWQPPFPPPETGGPWIWNEELGDWEEIIIPEE